MRVKLLVAGIIYSISILIKSGASNKCYRAKICIHDGKEKCGQDLEGNVRRFLDSCDMKEYNCIHNSNYLKTNPAKCRNLPVAKKKPSADHTVTDHDDSGKTAEQNENTEKASSEGNINEVDKDDSNLDVSQENENIATSETDVDRISREEGVKEANQKDQVFEVDVIVVSKEITNDAEKREDRATENIEANGDTEEEIEKNAEEDGDVGDDNEVDEDNAEDGVDKANNSNEPGEDKDNGQIDEISSDTGPGKLEDERDEYGKSEEADHKKVNEENEEDEVYNVNNSNEPREDDDNGQTNGISEMVSDSASKLENEHDGDEDRSMNDDVETADKLLAHVYYDNDELD